MYSVVLVDDHSLLRSGLATLINTYDDYKVMFEADHGKDFIQLLMHQKKLPDLVLLDITMPVMDGFLTARWIKENHPEIKILALSMMDDETTIIKMLRSGATGYILKNTKGKELLAALDSIMAKGVYYNEQVTNNVFKYALRSNEGEETLPSLTIKETEFLILACSEKTYKQIAEEMHISIRTIEDYRGSVCAKLGIKTRVELALYAIKQGYVKW
ncbi:response regulator [Parasediminibacterium sp. JCM 36343]|uniref:response regulator n=1 Tax=Parasediminibacterium sp. JCM 36343 TaxID=3374279 RepID=UPI00397A7E9A